MHAKAHNARARTRATRARTTSSRAHTRWVYPNTYLAEGVGFLTLPPLDERGRELLEGEGIMGQQRKVRVN